MIITRGYGFPGIVVEEPISIDVNIEDLEIAVEIDQVISVTVEVE